MRDGLPASSAWARYIDEVEDRVEAVRAAAGGHDRAGPLVPVAEPRNGTKVMPRRVTEEGDVCDEPGEITWLESWH